MARDNLAIFYSYLLAYTVNFVFLLPQCPDVGIGRQARLRGVCRKA